MKRIEPAKQGAYRADYDGKYRWTFSVNLFRDLHIAFLVWKIFFFIFLAVFAFVFLLDLTGGSLDARRVSDFFRVCAYVFAGMTVLVILGYLIYALNMGGEYIVEFTMDEKGIDHRQTAAQAKKARKLGALTASVGAASGSFGAAGAGRSAQKTELYTEFERVRKIKAYPRRHLIRLSAGLEHNEVYVDDEHFFFVLDYIRTRCENLNEKKR